MATNTVGLTQQQLNENYGAFIHEQLYLSETKSLISRVEILEGRGQVPVSPKTTVDATSGDITITWTAPPTKPLPAQSYIVHYGPVNDSNPHAAIFMAYSETTSFTLAAGDIPVPNKSGDKVYFWVQSFNEKTPAASGATNAEKAQALLDKPAWGSEWSTPTIATVK